MAEEGLDVNDSGQEVTRDGPPVEALVTLQARVCDSLR